MPMDFENRNATSEMFRLRRPANPTLPTDVQGRDMVLTSRLVSLAGFAGTWN